MTASQKVAIRCGIVLSRALEILLVAFTMPFPGRFRLSHPADSLQVHHSCIPPKISPLNGIASHRPCNLAGRHDEPEQSKKLGAFAIPSYDDGVAGSRHPLRFRAFPGA
jgi:hypothetical protein